MMEKFPALELVILTNLKSHGIFEPQKALNLYIFFKVPPNEETGTTNQKDEKVVVVVSQSNEHQSHREEPKEDCLRPTGREEHKVSVNGFSCCKSGD